MNETVDRKIGLALSGGGSRAIAFHLGCLRALNHLGLLHRVNVLSTVSGGSVIGAYYQAHQGDFSSFELKIRELLSRGLAKPMARRLFSLLGAKIVVAFIAIGLVAMCVALVRVLVNIASLVTPSWLSNKFERLEIRSPLHRFASRTSLLEAVLDDLLYKGASLTTADRDDPYIDFGLARYGTSEAAGRIVYARGDLGIRCAYLAHFPSGGFGWRDNFELASSPPQELEELCALVKNPSLSDETLKMCFEKRGVFEKLTDEAFQSVLVAVSDNERLMTPYDDKYMDGYADYSYHSVFEAAWKLTLTAPVTAKWAGVLYHLLYRCQPPHSFDAVAAMERWYFPPTKEGETRDYGFYLRSRLADVLKADDALLKSKDAALRTSFYRRFDPGVYRRWPEFLSDVEYFLESALHNNLLWRNRELRDVLSKLCWDHPDPRSNLDMPNAYNAVEERMLKEHPEWFDDNAHQ